MAGNISKWKKNCKVGRIVEILPPPQKKEGDLCRSIIAQKLTCHILESEKGRERENLRERKTEKRRERGKKRERCVRVRESEFEKRGEGKIVIE